MSEIAFTGERVHEGDRLFGVDLVVSFQVIGHLAHPADYLAEISTREESR